MSEFNLDIFLKAPIVFEDYLGKGINIFNLPEPLNDFCFGSDDASFANTIKKGAQSLRVGYYKILEEPHFRENLFTHAANVLFYRDGYSQPVKYYANVGPLINYEAKYGDNEISPWNYFIKNGRYGNKDEFFKGLTAKVFRVIRDEWIKSEKFKTEVKKITWTLIA